MENQGGVRKGAWTREEDSLLRDCIDKYGEGKWHLVPIRAGLNRCRKSCRLRWLNYLRPNIKRGSFSRDEVDLIKRMHKLLGNRWSLIAGRLPDRTANDVKNLWNTHIDKKSSKGCRQQRTKAITESNIIRPHPHTVFHVQQRTGESRNSGNSKAKKSTKSLILDGVNGNHQIDHQHATSPSMHEAVNDNGDCIRWWNELLEINEIGESGSTLVFPNNGKQKDFPTPSTSDPLRGP